MPIDRLNIPGLDESMQRAIELARMASDVGDVPVGAVVTLNGKVIGEGFNRREKDQLPTAHAEILAIQSAARALGSWRLIGCTLVVTLEPCPMCLAACQLARVSDVFYGTADAKGGALSLGYKLHEDGRTNHRFKVELHETPECGKILKEFFAELRKSRD